MTQNELIFNLVTTLMAMLALIIPSILYYRKLRRQQLWSKLLRCILQGINSEGYVEEETDNETLKYLSFWVLDLYMYPIKKENSLTVNQYVYLLKEIKKDQDKQRKVFQTSISLSSYITGKINNMPWL